MKNNWIGLVLMFLLAAPAALWAADAATDVTIVPGPSDNEKAPKNDKQTDSGPSTAPIPGATMPDQPPSAPAPMPDITAPAPVEKPDKNSEEHAPGPSHEPGDHSLDSSVPSEPLDSSYIPAPPDTPSGPEMPAVSSDSHAREGLPEANEKSASALSVERYAAGDSSIAFKPADELGEQEKTWGMAGHNALTASKSTTQFLVTGRIVSIDTYRNKVTVMDRLNHSKTLYVNSSDLSGLRKGSYVQATVQPGQEKAESIHQVLGG